MKKLNWFALFVLVAVFALVPAFSASAREDELGDDRDENKGRPTSTVNMSDDDLAYPHGNEDVNKDKENSNATSSVKKATSTPDADDSDEDLDEDKNDDKDSKSEGEEHRSEVASAVRKLLEVADRQGGIGAEVREIAREQNESEATTTKAVKEVEDRGGFKIFLVGSDYKNIGAIRSELASTDKRIERLQAAADKLPAGADKDELEEQINTLKDSQADLKEFIEDNEDKFSLFGWMVRLFGE